MPDVCFDRILIDGTWMKSTNQAGAAWVALDCSGHAIVYRQYTFVALSALVAEAKACFEAMNWCVQQNIKAITIYTDCQVLIPKIKKVKEVDWEIIQKIKEVDWEIMNVVLNIRSLCNQFDYAFISEALRKVVEAALVAAKIASKWSK